MHDANAADARATGPSGPATDGRSVLPGVVSAEQWQNARDALLIKEKRATRALDALAAERRRLPVVEFRADYAFEGPESTASLLDLFDRYSFRDRSFNIDCGIGKSFGLSAFLRDGERVFRSRFTTGRGGPPALGPERARLTVFGRQEDWEDSPAGRPKTPALCWWRLHDEYEPPKKPA